MSSAVRASTKFSWPRQPAAAPANEPLSKEQKRLVQDTFRMIEPASDLMAALFYLRVLELDPSVRMRFKKPTKGQSRTLMEAMKVATLSLEHPDSFSPVLRLIGARYRQQGVRPADYVTFAMAWIWAMQQSLGKRFNRQAKLAWTSLLAQMTRVLIA